MVKCVLYFLANIFFDNHYTHFDTLYIHYVYFAVDVCIQRCISIGQRPVFRNNIADLETRNIWVMMTYISLI